MSLTQDEVKIIKNVVQEACDMNHDRIMQLVSLFIDAPVYEKSERFRRILVGNARKITIPFFNPERSFVTQSPWRLCITVIKDFLWKNHGHHLADLSRNNCGCVIVYMFLWKVYDCTLFERSFIGSKCLGEECKRECEMRNFPEKEEYVQLYEETPQFIRNRESRVKNHCAVWSGISEMSGKDIESFSDMIYFANILGENVKWQNPHKNQFYKMKRDILMGRRPEICEFDHMLIYSAGFVPEELHISKVETIFEIWIRERKARWAVMRLLFVGREKEPVCHFGRENLPLDIFKFIANLTGLCEIKKL